MNMRRLSYGLLVSFAAAMMAACGDSTPPAETPPQPTAAPADTATAAPTQTAEATPPPPPPEPPPPPPPPPAKESFNGKLAQDYSGEVADADKAAAEKAGGKKADAKKIEAKATALKAAFDKVGRSIEISGNGTRLEVIEGGKVKKSYTIEIVGGDDKGFTLKLVKDGKKELKPAMEIAVSLANGVFSFKDPWAKKDAKTLAFKKQ